MRSFVKHIVKHIENNTDLVGYGLAMQRDDGKVIVWNDDGTEAVNVGPTDKKGNYFYIRTIDNNGFTEREITAQTGACHRSQEQSADLRLVAVWRCADPEQLVNYFKTLLVDAVNAYISYQVKAVSVSRVNDVYETVYRQETGAAAAVWSPGVQLVAIDFKLKYQYDICKLNQTSKPC